MSDYEDGSDYKPNLGPSRDGSPPPPPMSPMGASTQDSFSVGSLITGIFALVLGVFCGLLAVPLGIVAIVMGVKGRQRSRELGRGTGLATAGIVMGGAAIVFTVIFLAAAMIFGFGAD